MDTNHNLYVFDQGDVTEDEVNELLNFGYVKWGEQYYHPTHYKPLIGDELKAWEDGSLAVTVTWFGEYTYACLSQAAADLDE